MVHNTPFARPRRRLICLLLTASLVVAHQAGSVRAQGQPAGENAETWQPVVEALARGHTAALDTLKQRRPAVEADQAESLLSALQDAWLGNRSDAWSRELIAFAEALAKDHDRAGTLLIRMLEDPRPAIRQAALEAAVRVEAAGNQRILPLISTLHFGAPADRYQAARLLGMFGAQAEPAAGALVRAALDETAHVSVRWEAVYSLRDIGAGGVEGLAEVAAAAEKSVAYKALDSLAVLKETAEPAYDTVAEALQRSDPNIRWRAAFVLGRMPSRAADSLPLLQRATSDSDQHVREAAAEAIDRLSREPQRGELRRTGEPPSRIKP